MKSFYLYILVICWQLATTSSAQNHIKTLRVEDGLSQGFVTCMIQDKRGFMWFGTYDGLNRYDGYTVRRFSSKPFDPWTLQSSFITQLYEDKRELLWVGTHHGLHVFDPLTERFFNLSLPAYPLPAHPVDKIIVDRDGTVFVQFPAENNSSGVFELRLPDDFVTRLRQKDQPISGILAEQLKVPPTFTPPGHLFLCLGDTMPLVVDRDERLFGYSKAQRALQPFDPKTLPGSETDDHNFLKGKYVDYNFRRRLSDGRDTVYPPVKCYPLLPLMDGSRGIWFYPNGPFFRKNNHAPIEFDLSREKKALLADPAFHQAFTPLVEESRLWNNITMMDRSGTLWVGTGGLGIRIINPGQHAFVSLLPGKSTSSLRELPNGQLWVRFYSEESLVIDPATGQTVPAPWGFNTWLNEAVADRKGNYWLVEVNIPPYSGKRLLRYDQQTRQLIRFPVVLPFLNGVPEKIIEDGMGIFG
jgi:streptogramin lyase